jgi:hypothetical protein
MLLATAARSEHYSDAWCVAVNDPTPVIGNHEETVQDTKVSVGTVKKSIAAITSRWLFRKAAQRFADTGLLGTFRIQRKTVLSEMSKLSIFNSP